MLDIYINEDVAEELSQLYRDMELSYNRVARMLDFGCKGCDDNCCDSYFQHHTYIEWWYLWQGLKGLSRDEMTLIEDRSREYLLEAERFLAGGERPQIMCPLNRDGLCMVYTHRLLVCRTHGVPAQITYPDGRKSAFPGCFRCQKKAQLLPSPPYVDRTAFLRKMASLENRFLHGRRNLLPRLNMTIAEMVMKGPPNPAQQG